MRTHFIETSIVTNKAPLVHIFDAGGILIDKGDQYFANIVEAVEVGGCAWTKEDAKNTDGFKLYDVHDYIMNNYDGFGLSDFDEFNNVIKEIRGRGETFEAFPEFVEVVEIVKSQGAKLAVVSDSSRDRLCEMIDGVSEYNRDDFFVVSRSDMEDIGKKGKPFPDMCLHVAEHFDVMPSQCLMWDDSVRGAECGVTAGVNVCWVNDREEGKDHPVPSKNMIDSLSNNIGSLDIVGYSGVVSYAQKLHKIDIKKHSNALHSAFVISYSNSK